MEVPKRVWKRANDVFDKLVFKEIMEEGERETFVLGFVSGILCGRLTEAAETTAAALKDMMKKGGGARIGGV